MGPADKTKEEFIEEIGLLNKRIAELENDRRESRQQMLLQRIIDLLPIRVFWKNKELRFQGCNEAFAKDAGEDSPEDLIGRDDFQMAWKAQADDYRADDQHVMSSGKGRFNFEEPQTTPRGDKIWLKTSKMPLTDREGNTIGILGVYEDITEQKRLVEAERESIENMERMNRQMMDREMRIIDVKKEVNKLCKELGRTDRYSGGVS